MVYTRIVRRMLFRLGGGDPEIAHERTLAGLARLGRVGPAVAVLRRYFGAATPRTVFGVRFPGPVGLAAGMDKDGLALRAWPAMGFGFVEVGTVTRLAQEGNPRPRLFRLPASTAIINRMGFNNAGATTLAARLATFGRLAVPLGISIGKSRITPVTGDLDEVITDYLITLRTLYSYADYFAVNVSSPNTPGLRGLQQRRLLDELTGALAAEADGMPGGGKPLLIKIAPELSDQAIDEVLEVCEAHRVAGVIATNTTTSRDGLAPADTAVGAEAGGLSGAPLAARARDVVAYVAKHTEGQLPIIGVGGICSADDAARMLDAGASLVQLYTGFVYHGPALVRRINRLLTDSFPDPATR